MSTAKNDESRWGSLKAEADKIKENEKWGSLKKEAAKIDYGQYEQYKSEYQPEESNDALEETRKQLGVDNMNFFERLWGTAKNMLTGAGKGIGEGYVGVGASAMNRGALNATDERYNGPGQNDNSYSTALNAAAKNLFYGIYNNPDMDFTSQENEIRKVANYIGGEDYANKVIERVKSYASEAKEKGNDIYLSNTLLDGLTPEEGKLWNNMQQDIASTGIYDTMKNLAESRDKDIQTAKAMNPIEGPVGDFLVEGGVSALENTADALLAVTLGLSGNAALIPFAFRAYGNSYAEALRMSGDLGQQIGIDAAKNAAAYGGQSSAIEVGTEMLWGMAGAFSKATKGGALDDFVQNKLVSAISDFAKTEKGAKVLSWIGTKLLGGVTEGLEEVIGDIANDLLNTSGIVQGEGILGERDKSFGEGFKEIAHSFVTGAVAGLMGNVTGKAVSPIQQMYNARNQAQVGKQLKNGAVLTESGELLDSESLLEKANAPEMQDTVLQKAVDQLYQGLPRSPESFSNREIGKLYDAYEETTAKRNDTIERIGNAVKKLSDGGELKTSEVNRITQNSDAMNYLEKMVGSKLDMSGDNYQRKQALETALKALASDSTPLSEAAQGNTQSPSRIANTATYEQKNVQPITESVMEQKRRADVAEIAKSMPKSTETVMNRLYSPAQNSTDYIEEFTRVRKAGMDGADRMPDMSTLHTLNEAQAKAAFAEGVIERKHREAAKNGEDHYNEQERVWSKSSSGAYNRVERGTGRARAQRSRSTQKARAAEVRAAAEAEGWERKSTKQIGYANGTDKLTVRIASESFIESHPELKKHREEDAAKGITDIFFSGELEFVDDRGKIAHGRGESNTDTNISYVCLDDPKATWEQVADHEDYHLETKNDVWIATQIVLDSGHYEDLTRAYADLYFDGEVTDDVLDRILVEIAADLTAGIDALTEVYQTAPNLPDAVFERARELKNQLVKEGANGSDHGNTRFSQVADVRALEGVDWMGESTSIKDQLAKHKAEIETMSPLKKVEYAGERKEDLIAVILEQVSKIGGKSMKQGTVSFTFDEKAAREIVSHANTDAIRAAAILAPYVAKYGKLIAGHKYHEGKQTATLTFAAPVYIFDTRALMGVAVQFTKDGRPHAVNVDVDSATELNKKMKSYQRALRRTGHSQVSEPPTSNSFTDKSIVQSEEPVKQKFSSSGTSLNQVPALHKDSRIEWGDTNVDIGAGAYEAATEYLKEKGVTNYKWDPYNQPEEVNRATLQYLKDGNKADTATCANVLNVIAEKDARLNVILQAAKAIKEDGKAYFMVYEGDGSGVGKETTKGYQNNLKTREYVDEIKTYFDNVEQHGKLIVATEPKAKLPNASWEVKPGKAERFSMTAPVEATDRLIALHNMNEDALRGMLELGGLAMPSVAIKPANMGHNTYGDISAVYGRDSVDPKKKGNRIYSRDAWTPVFPDVAIKINSKESDKLQSRIRGLLGSEAKEFDVALDPVNLADQIGRRGSFFGGYKDGDAFRLAFLRDTGRELNVPMRTKQFSSVVDNQALAKVAKRVDLEDAVKDWRSMQKYTETVREILQDYYDRKYGDELGRKLYGHKGDLSFSEMEGILRAASRYQYSGPTKEIDKKRLKTRLDIAFRTKKVQSEYENWMNELGKNLIEKRGVRNNKDMFTPSGNRRSFEQLYYDYTLDNIVRAMQSQEQFGRKTALTTSGNIAGATSKTYSSIEEARSDIGKVRDNFEETDLQEVQDFSEHARELVQDLTRGKRTDLFDAAELLTEVFTKARSEEAIYRALQIESEWFNVTREIAHDAYELLKEGQNLPAPYLEGKMYRAVPIDEALAYVVPDNMNKDLKQQLKDAGGNVVEYKHGDSEDRLKKVNSVEGARFSRKAVDSSGKELSEGQQEYFADSKVRDENGALKVMYQGSDEDFTVFDRKKSKSSNLYGRGFYFTDEEHGAKIYGRTKPYYLNIVNPLSPGQNVITKQQMRKFLNAVAENEDEYDLFNYGENASVESVLKSVYGKGDFEMLLDVNLTAIGDMVAAVELFNEVNGTDYDGLILPSETVIFNSEQAKNIDNLNPTSNPDVRFSRKVEEYDVSQQLRELRQDLREALKEATKQTNRAEYWKGQTKLTEGLRLRAEDVRKIAKKLVSDYGSTIQTKDIEKDLQELAEAFISEEDFEDTYLKAANIATKIVENAVELSSDPYVEVAREIRDHIKKHGLEIRREDANDIPDFNAWRTANGLMHVRYGESSDKLTQYYEELSSMYPDLFPDEITHPADQLEQIANVLSDWTSVYVNPYDNNIAEAVEECSADIAASILKGYGEGTLRKMAPTAADRLKARLEGEMEAAVSREREKAERTRKSLEQTLKEEREKSKAKLKEVRERRDQKIEALKEHYREVATNERNRKEDRTNRQKLLRIVRRLNNKKLPEVQRSLLNQYIGDIDTIAVGITGRTIEKLENLRNWYADRVSEDPDLKDSRIEDVLKRLSQRRISDLTADEVAALTQVLLGIEYQINTANHLLDEQERRDIFTLGMRTVEDIDNARGSMDDRFALASDLGNVIARAVDNPEREIRRMTGYVDDDPLYQRIVALNEGQRRSLEYVMLAEHMVEEWESDTKFMETLSGNRAKAIEISGIGNDGKVTKAKITPAMRISLYLHSKNEDNLRHIREGGVTIPDYDWMKKGNTKRAYGSSKQIRLTSAQIREICKGMSEKELGYARAISRYFNEMSKAAINETSLKLKGYEIATVPNYFPINTDDNFTRDAYQEMGNNGDIQGMNFGFLKERVDYASNPVYLRDANRVLAQAINMHSRYYGLAVAMRDFQKLYNVQGSNYNEAGERMKHGRSVKDSIKHKWDESGKEYIEDLIKQLNGHKENKKFLDRLFGKVRGVYAGAVIPLNLGVAAKQTASYPTAAAVLGWGPLAKAMKDFGKVDLDLIARYTPLQWQRSRKSVDMDRGTINYPKILDWVRNADLMTTRKLWKASEYYVKDHNKNLKVGTDEYYREVAKIYNKCIEETQPNFTTMQRGALLRSDSEVARMVFLFKTQPFQNTGILIDATGNLLAKRKQLLAASSENKAQAEAAFREAKKYFRNAVTSQVVQQAIYAAMTALWALFRGKVKKYKDDEDQYTVASVGKAIGTDMLANAMGGVPFGSEVYQFVDSLLFGGTYYGVDGVSLTAINDMFNAILSISKTIGNSAEEIVAGNDIDWNALRLKGDKFMDTVSKVAGVPYENVMNLFTAVSRNVATAAAGKYAGEYVSLYLTTDPAKNKKEYYDLLYKAYKNDKAAYDQIRKAMIDAPSDPFATSSKTAEENIDNAIKERKGKEIKQEQTYENLYSSVSSSSIWNKATEAQRSKVEEDLYHLAMAKVLSDSKGQEIIDKANSANVSDTTWLLYQLALKIVDQPEGTTGHGNVSMDEAQKAIAMLSGLTQKQKADVFAATNNAWKQNPYK